MKPDDKIVYMVIVQNNHVANAVFDNMKAALAYQDKMSKRYSAGEDDERNTLVQARALQS